MGYHPNSLRLPQFYRYIQRVFDFQKQVSQLNDNRIAPDVKTETLFEALCLCLLLRLASFEALVFEISCKQAKKVIRHPEAFSINTLRYGLSQFETEPLDGMLRSVTQQMKRSKMLSDTICGLHVAALDGTAYYRSATVHCPDCMAVHLNDDQYPLCASRGAAPICGSTPQAVHYCRTHSAKKSPTR